LELELQVLGPVIPIGITNVNRCRHEFFPRQNCDFLR